MNASPHDAAAVFLRIELIGVQPLVWRRVRVAPTMSLAKLHTVLQIAMGWQDRHAHQYRLGALRIGHGGEEDAAQQAEGEWLVSEIIATGASEFLYEYDFGDGWLHRVVIEPASGRPMGAVPACLAGEQACPPEDVGGPAGYRVFCAAMADPQHAAHGEMCEWLGRDWDPAAFDLEAVNAALKRARV